MSTGRDFDWEIGERIFQPSGLLICNCLIPRGRSDTTGVGNETESLVALSPMLAPSSQDCSPIVRSGEWPNE
jgi:hypothetical protein